MSSIAKYVLFTAAAVTVIGANAGTKDKIEGKRPPAIRKKLEGKIVDARFDSVTGKIVLQVKTERYCNGVSPSLKPTIAGKATFGPFHYNLSLGVSDSKGCIPKEERIREIAVDAPELNTKQGFYIATIHGEDGTAESVKVDLRAEDQTYAAEDSDVKEGSSGAGESVTFEQVQDFAAGDYDAAAGAAR